SVGRTFPEFARPIQLGFHAQVATYSRVSCALRRDLPTRPPWKESRRRSNIARWPHRFPFAFPRFRQVATPRRDWLSVCNWLASPESRHLMRAVPTAFFRAPAAKSFPRFFVARETRLQNPERACLRWKSFRCARALASHTRWLDRARHRRLVPLIGLPPTSSSRCPADRPQSHVERRRGLSPIREADTLRLPRRDKFRLCAEFPEISSGRNPDCARKRRDHFRPLRWSL